MALDKAIDSAVLDSGLTSVANAIRNKGGTSEVLEFPAGFVSAVNAISASGLNFEVVGNPEPSNPKENTIWLDTDTSITKWVIAVDNPYLSKVNVSTSDANSHENSYWCFTDGTTDRVENTSFTAMYYIPLPDNTVSVTIPTIDAATTEVVHWFSKDDPGDENLYTYISHVYRDHENFTYAVPDGAQYISPSIHDSDPKTIIANVNTAVDGDIWIFEDAASFDAEFSTLEVYGLQIYLLSARQYINGAWKKVSAKIYRNGAWVDCVSNLYNKGKTDHVVNTKAMRSTASSSITAANPTIGINQTNFWGYIKPDSTGGRAGIVYISPKVDLTRASTLHVEGTFASDYNASFPYVGLWSEFGTNAQENRVAFKSACSATNEEVTKTVSIDVSGISGKYYIGFFMSATTVSCTINIKRIYFD